MRGRQSSLDQIRREHSSHRIAARLTRVPRQAYLRDWVYGGIDGAVTTFAVVSGVTGATLSSRVILIMGIANLIADGFSMAAANYAGTRTELEQAKRLEAAEQNHMAVWPKGQREEIRQILATQGLSGEPLDKATTMIAADRVNAARLVVSAEYGSPTQDRSPGWAALSTFSAFLICGSVPLLAYVLALPSPFLTSCVLTGLTFFGIGSLRGRWTLVPWWRSGAITLALGGTAAILAYVVGALINSVA